MYNTADLTAKYLRKEFENDLDAKVLVIGEPGLKDELVIQGFSNAQMLADDLKSQGDYEKGMSDKQFKEFELDPSVKAIVNGFSLDLDFRQIAVASMYL